MKEISKNVASIAQDRRREEALAKQARRNLSGPERTFASEINMMGRKACFDEHLCGIPVENQNLKEIPGIPNITKTFSFEQGYQRGLELIRLGNVPEEYQNINSNKHR